MAVINGIIDIYGTPVFEKVDVINVERKIKTTIRAIVDTGAHDCYMSKKVIEALGLPVIGTTKYVHPILGQTQTDLYQASLGIQQIVFPKFKFAITPYEKYPYDLILGCTFLWTVKLYYDGFQKEFTIDLGDQSVSE